MKKTVSRVRRFVRKTLRAAAKEEIKRWQEKNNFSIPLLRRRILFLKNRISEAETMHDCDALLERLRQANIPGPEYFRLWALAKKKLVSICFGELEKANTVEALVGLSLELDKIAHLGNFPLRKSLRLQKRIREKTVSILIEKIEKTRSMKELNRVCELTVSGVSNKVIPSKDYLQLKRLIEKKILELKRKK